MIRRYPAATTIAAAVLLTTLAAIKPAWAEAHLSYSAYSAGFNVLNIDASLDITPKTYRIEFTSRTAGAFSLLVSGEITTTVAGLRTLEGVAPTRSYSYGTFRGNPRRVQIDYVNGQPELRILEPASEANRDPVPSPLWRDTIDPESALASLIYRVNLTGRCETAVRTFDGRRLSEINAVTIGMEVLSPDRGSAFSGAALRCDFEGRQLAGFMHDADSAELKRVQHGSAWFAKVAPGGLSLPVRIGFSTRFFGTATMYLTKHE